MFEVFQNPPKQRHQNIVQVHTSELLKNVLLPTINICPEEIVTPLSKTHFKTERFKMRCFAKPHFPCSELYKLYYTHAYLGNFVINEFNPTFEIQRSGNGTLQDTYVPSFQTVRFRTGFFKTRVTVASGLIVRLINKI